MTMWLTRSSKGLNGGNIQLWAGPQKPVQENDVVGNWKHPGYVDPEDAHIQRSIGLSSADYGHRIKFDEIKAVSYLGFTFGRDERK